MLRLRTIGIWLAGVLVAMVVAPAPASAQADQETWDTIDVAPAEPSLRERMQDRSDERQERRTERREERRDRFASRREAPRGEASPSDLDIQIPAWSERRRTADRGWCECLRDFWCGRRAQD